MLDCEYHVVMLIESIRCVLYRTERWHNHNAVIYHSLIFNFAESIDELTDMVRELFCKIPNKDVLVPVFPDDPYSEDELQVMCV